HDLLGAYDFLVGAGVPPNRIAYLGFSLGGAISLLTASQQGSVQAVVADSSFADISDLIAEEVPKRSPAPRWAVPALLPGTIVAARLVYGIDIRAISPGKAIAKYPHPVLLIHGLKDERIPTQHAQRLVAASPNKDTQLWLVPDAEHARAFKAQPQEYVQRLVSYLDSRFPQTQP
ncbi:MAG: prolyl oligopeptidase family serine peptidase, partial [Chloroflexi bacterium]|nr:prolyl oligopeptidase family serine peptidase [Chloroflexota bacterium]